jgi:hypothetical protein
MDPHRVHVMVKHLQLHDSSTNLNNEALKPNEPRLLNENDLLRLTYSSQRSISEPSHFNYHGTISNNK